MKTYELTQIISSGINSEQAIDITKEIESFIQSKEGVILKSEKTQAQTLAYPIKKQSSGYFFTLTFQILEDKIKEVVEKIEKDKQILRHFVIVKKPIKELKERRTRKPLEIFRPSSTMQSPFNKINENKDKSGKLDLDEIDKKLDEILSE